MTTKTWVLLRGLTREAGHWGGFGATLARALAAGAPDGRPPRIVALDLPGHGESAWSPSGAVGIGGYCGYATASLP